MGQVQSSEYYGRIIDDPVHLTGRAPFYELAYSMIPIPPDQPVADIGCGCGALAEIISAKGHKNYWGVDFSPERIAVAKQRIKNYEFVVGDVFDPGVVSQFDKFRYFFVLEILEHVEDDLGLLRSIPPGRDVIFSVPSFDDPAHVRRFNSLHEVTLRYQNVLQLQTGATGKDEADNRMWFFVHAKS